MSIYQKIADVGTRFIKPHVLFKHGFNLSPMYRRSTGRVIEVSEDLMHVKVKIPISLKNRNYMNSIFGGSMFSAVDPIPMVQLINILGKDYVVWDRSAEIVFKKPAKQDLYATFIYTEDELREIKTRVERNKEIDIIKRTRLTNKSGDLVFSEVTKVIYVADKNFYKAKRRSR